MQFNARLQLAGYIYKIEVDVNNTPVFFEKDEEGEWRALVTEQHLDKNKTVSKEVLQAIADYIDFITK